MMKYILLAAVLFQADASCPNGCSGHGTCDLNDQCTCFNERGKEDISYASDEFLEAICFNLVTADFQQSLADFDLAAREAACSVPNGAHAGAGEYICAYDAKTNSCLRVVRAAQTGTDNVEWRGADCSRRTCPRATSWSAVGAVEESKDYICTHQTEVECSDQGLCDRATGLCECFPGFTGAACQRTECPDDCSGHGTCRSNKDFAYDFSISKTKQLLVPHEATERYRENYIVTYDNAWDSGQLYGCLCDQGYRGANCALIECPSSNDPLDDKCSDSQDAGTVENFQVQKFAPTGSQGWREAYEHSTSAEQSEDPCIAYASDQTGCEAVRESGGAGTCTFTPEDTVNGTPSSCAVTAPWETLTAENIKDENNHYLGIKVYACFGAMSGQDCSGRGLCDYSTGQCNCFEGYAGTSCAKIQELV